MKVIVDFQPSGRYEGETYEALWIVTVKFDVLGRLFKGFLTKPTAKQIRKLKKRAKNHG